MAEDEMTRDEIIRMAREAGWTSCASDIYPPLERFAELIKQHIQIEQMPKFEELAEIVREDERAKLAKCLHETDIYDFAGWLTTRPGVMVVGSSCEAGPMAEAVGEYIAAFPERFGRVK